MIGEIVYSGRNLLNTLNEGYKRKIITFVDHEPKGSDFHINLDILLGNQSETKKLRELLANYEIMNAIIPIPQTWTKKTERSYLSTLNDNLYRRLWDHPVIEPLRQIFMARHNGMSIDTFFDLIGLHVLSNFLSDRPQDIFDTLHTIRARVTSPTGQTKNKKKTSACKKISKKIQIEFSLRYKMFRKIINSNGEDEEGYNSIVKLGLQHPDQITDIILKTWNKQPETFWSDILEEIHDTTPIQDGEHVDLNYSRNDWLEWWQKNKPTS